MPSRKRLEELTDRWRRRREARRRSGIERPIASPEREALATKAFPYRSVSPARYVAAHGADMPAFTYDDDRYRDAELDAWIIEVGGLLRERR